MDICRGGCPVSMDMGVEISSVPACSAMFDVNSVEGGHGPAGEMGACPTNTQAAEEQCDAGTITRKISSASSSPSKMESCMFSFPVPAPRMWTIMVEPITKQAADHPQLQTWRPNHYPNGERNCDENNNAEAQRSPRQLSLALPPILAPPSSSSSSNDSSPQKAKKRQKIWLNGTCIDSGRTCRQRGPKPKNDGHGGRVFTFVPDKRMPTCRPAPPKTTTCKILTQKVPSISQPTAKLIRCTTFETQIGSGAGLAMGLVKGRKFSQRQRNGGKKPLTFHQLEFNSETLKPFDRSVFILTSVSGAKPDARPSQVLVEAAEMLLELQTDAVTGGLLAADSCAGRRPNTLEKTPVITPTN